VKQYNKVLRQLLIHHRSFEKLDFLQSNHHLMSVDDFQILFNWWDTEVMQLMLALEKRCNKFCDGSIKFSPVTSIWIRCLQAFIAGFSNSMRIKRPMEATCFEPAGALTFPLC
jgi:hypothetical protein